MSRHDWDWLRRRRRGVCDIIAPHTSAVVGRQVRHTDTAPYGPYADGWERTELTDCAAMTTATTTSHRFFDSILLHPLALWHWVLVCTLQQYTTAHSRRQPRGTADGDADAMMLVYARPAATSVWKG